MCGRPHSACCEWRSVQLLLLPPHPVWGLRNGALGRRRGNSERQPGIPAVRPIFCIKFPVSFYVQVPLHVSDGENISELRADAEDPRPEASKDRVSADVVGDLLIGIADKTNENLLREKLRHPPIEMEIDAALNLRVWILEVVGEAGNA